MNEYKFIPASRISLVITRIKQILLPDPNDERDISLEWARNKIHEQLDELTKIIDDLDLNRGSTLISFNDSSHPEKNIPEVIPHERVPDLVGILNTAIAEGDYRTVKLVEYTSELIKTMTRKETGAGEIAHDVDGSDIKPSSVGQYLDILRNKGLTVAVHNDYKLNGEHYTFWLITESTGMSYKGEGKTDMEALEKVLSAVEIRTDFIRSMSSRNVFGITLDSESKTPLEDIQAMMDEYQSEIDAYMEDKAS